MFTASQKRKENIAEYLLYMWQIEDLIRANNLDIDAIGRTLIEPTHFDDKQKQELIRWYESLIEMMRREDVTQKGHLQINRNILIDISDMHRRLLADPKKSDYQAQFYKTLPYIVELRSKAGEARTDEIETCFNALYGLLMMRLRRQEISPDTLKAMSEISRLIAMLAAEYHREENSPDPADE